METAMLMVIDMMTSIDPSVYFPMIELEPRELIYRPVMDTIYIYLA